MLHALTIRYTTLVIGMVYIEGNSHLSLLFQKFFALNITAKLLKKISRQLRTIAKSTIAVLARCKFIECVVGFKSKRFFICKDKLPKMILSGLAYKCKCGGCNTTYYRKTKRHFKVRVCEHLGISLEKR